MIKISTPLGSIAVRQRGRGPAVVLAHSLFVDSRSWDEVAEQLARSFRVVLIDGPGMGSSTPCPAQRYTLDDCADAMHDVLEALALPSAHWVGNAWGGHVGTVLAARRTPRLASLMAISSPFQPMSSRFKVKLLVALYRLIGARSPVMRPLRAAMIDPSRLDADPDLSDQFETLVRAQRRGDLHVAMQSVMLGRRSLVPRLGRIDIPTTFVTGDNPSWPLATAQQQAEQLPGCRVQYVAGTRHLQPMEAPAEIADLITAWLGEQRSLAA